MPATRREDPGCCLLCEAMINKGQMTRHLNRCIEKNLSHRSKGGKLFHLVIEGRRLPMYWLHVEIPGGTTLERLDSFLRDIWLECCGHLSCFAIDGQRYSVHPMTDPLFGVSEQSMGKRVHRVLGPGVKFTHEYDYGSTTELSLRVVGVRDGSTKSREIVLLARNKAPDLRCFTCGKPATQIHASGWGLSLDDLLCRACVGEEDEEQLLPVVNSPRVGVCGYCG